MTVSENAAAAATTAATIAPVYRLRICQVSFPHGDPLRPAFALGASARQVFIAESNARFYQKRRRTVNAPEAHPAR
jgi:hypothetical protein